MQDLVKNPARFLNIFLHIFVRFLQESYKKVLVKSYLGRSCKFLQDFIRFLQESVKILQEYSYKIFERLSG